MRLAASGVADARGIHGGIGRSGVVTGNVTPQIAAGAGSRGRVCVITQRRMRVRRQLTNIQRVRDLAADFAQRKTVAPKWLGTRPWRLGRAKLTCPSPP